MREYGEILNYRLCAEDGKTIFTSLMRVEGSGACILEEKISFLGDAFFSRAREGMGSKALAAYVRNQERLKRVRVEAIVAEVKGCISNHANQDRATLRFTIKQGRQAVHQFEVVLVYDRRIESFLPIGQSI